VFDDWPNVSGRTFREKPAQLLNLTRQSRYKSLKMGGTLDEIRAKRAQAMRRYRAALRPQYEPLSPAEIRQLRQRLGLSQRAFGAKVGVSLGTVIRWEGVLNQPRFLANERLQELQREQEAEGQTSTST
jgi:DNA-binding transcriptional regulator YiaG